MIADQVRYKRVKEQTRIISSTDIGKDFEYRPVLILNEKIMMSKKLTDVIKKEYVLLEMADQIGHLYPTIQEEIAAIRASKNKKEYAKPTKILSDKEIALNQENQLITIKKGQYITRTNPTLKASKNGMVVREYMKNNSGQIFVVVETVMDVSTAERLKNLGEGIETNFKRKIIPIEEFNVIYNPNLQAGVMKESKDFIVEAIQRKRELHQPIKTVNPKRYSKVGYKVGNVIYERRGDAYNAAERRGKVDDNDIQQVAINIKRPLRITESDLGLIVESEIKSLEKVAHFTVAEKDIIRKNILRNKVVNQNYDGVILKHDDGRIIVLPYGEEQVKEKGINVTVDDYDEIGIEQYVSPEKVQKIKEAYEKKIQKQIEKNTTNKINFKKSEIKKIQKMYLKEMTSALNIDERTMYVINPVSNIFNEKDLLNMINNLHEKVNKILRRRYIRAINKELSTGKLKPYKKSDKLQRGKFGSFEHITLNALQVFAHESLDHVMETKQKLFNYMSGDTNAQLDASLEKFLNDRLKIKLSPENTLAVMTALNHAAIDQMDNSSLDKTLAWIKEFKKEGRQNLAKKLDSQYKARERRNKKIAKLIRGGKDLKADFPADQLEKKKNLLQEYYNSQLDWTNLLDLLSKFDKKSGPYQSYLSKIGNEALFALNLQYANSEQTMELISELAQKSFGTKNKKDLSNLLKIMSTKQENLGKFRLKWQRKATYNLVLTKGQIGQKYLELKDPSLKETFEQMKWTDEMKAAIDNALTKEEKAWFDSFKIVYDFMYDKVNPIYKEIYGIDLPYNPFYVAINRDLQQTEEREETRFQRDAEHYGSYKKNHMKTRVPNNEALKYTDANTTLINYVTEMEHFAAWAKTAYEFRSIFNNKEVISSIKQYFGQQVLNKVNSYISDMARGGFETAKIINWVDRARGRFTTALLGVKPLIAFKQIPSVLAYATEMKLGQFFDGVIDFWKAPSQHGKLMMELSPYLRNRFMSGFERDVKIAMQQQWYQRITQSTKFTDVFMASIRAGDRFAVMQGCWAKFKTEMEGKKWTKVNMDKAMREAEAATLRTQPTSEHFTLSGIQNWGSIGKLFSMFRTQPNQYFKITTTSLRNLVQGRGSRAQNAKNLVMTWVLLPAIFQFLSDGLDWDWSDGLRILALGPINNLVIGGQLAQSMWNWIDPAYILGINEAPSKSKAFSFEVSPMFSMFNEMQYILSRFSRINSVANSLSTEEVIKLIEDMVELGGELSGIPTPYAVQLEKAMRKGDYRNIIYSDFVLENKSKVTGYTGDLLKRKNSITGKASMIDIANKKRVLGK